MNQNMTNASTEDLTTFDNENMNGWVKGPNGSFFVFKNEEDNNYFAGPEKLQNLQGVVLTKQISGFIPGEQYKIALQARKNDDRTTHYPNINFSGNGTDLFPYQKIENRDWKIYSGIFTADKESIAFVFKSTTTIDNGAVLGTSNIDIDNIRIGKLYQHLTGFENGLNDWVLGPATATGGVQIADEGGNKCLNFPTQAGNNAGVILTRQFNGLYPQQKYRFSMKVRRTNSAPAVPVLSLAVDGQGITAQTAFPSQAWTELAGEFMLPGFNATLDVISHVSEGIGNDYRIDDLRLEEIS